MKKLPLILGAIIGLLAAPAYAQTDIYYGLTILNPDLKTKSENQYILVENGKIKKTGEGLPINLPKDVGRHNFKGFFAMPGLFDTHAHPTLGPLSIKVENGTPIVEIKKNEAMARHNARMLLGHGITTIRDPGSDTSEVIKFRNKIKNQIFPGPDSLTAGLIIDNPPFPLVGLTADRTNKTIEEIVAGQVTEGVDYIKLYTGLSPEELKRGIDAAHANNVQAISHLGDVSWTTAANLGIDGLVHMFPTSPDLLHQENRKKYIETRRPGAFEFFEWFEYADLEGPEIKEAIAAMADNGVHIDATLIAFHHAFWGDQPNTRDKFNHLTYPASLMNWQTLFKFDVGWGADDYKRAKAIWPKILKLTKMVFDGGVLMSLGTDQGNPFVAPGASLYQEMKLHSDAGISNWDILKMATSNGADTMRLSDRTGRVKAGLEADIIFLTKDPSIEISNIDTVEAVLSNGVLYNSQDLKRTIK